jgi:hypothetical protein
VGPAGQSYGAVVRRAALPYRHDPASLADVRRHTPGMVYMLHPFWYTGYCTNFGAEIPHVRG